MARAVIWIPSGDHGWELEAARPYHPAWIGGGIRTLYEVAAALAAAGRDVEVRGPYWPVALDEICEAAGARPRLPGDPRPPAAGDTVIVPEGISDPGVHARLVLSPARAVLLVLGPPGLIGWPFTDAWSVPDPLTVAVDAVARPEHFRAAAALGYEIWTHTPGLQRAAQDAGVGCRLIGNGVPGGYPDPAPTRDIDVVWMRDNRWAPVSRPVVRRLSELGFRCLALDGAPHRAVLEAYGRARVVLHPLRVEGHSRIGCEARGMGAVPAVLRSNPFAVGLDEAGGALAVDGIADMADAVATLLATPERLADLSAAGMRSAREQVEWDAFVARVDEAFASDAAADVARPARGAIGAAVRGADAAARADLRAARDERDEARADLERHRGWLAAINASLSWRVTAPLRAAKRAWLGRAQGLRRRAAASARPRAGTRPPRRRLRRRR